jgi:IMP dehydrogenase
VIIHDGLQRPKEKTAGMRGVGPKTVAQVMRPDVVTVGPDATVGEAVEAMRRYRVGAVPVVKDEVVIGMVTTRDLLGQPVYRQIADVMSSDVATISSDETIMAAYSLMDSRGIGRLPVVDGGRLVGMITRQDTLHELGKLTDPLTDLPWPGTLRQRAADLLARGEEIVIVFIDLDRFRLVNKRLGHVA